MLITYGPDIIAFDCTQCRRRLMLMRHDSETALSVTFCPRCDEQYWTRWDGVLHSGEITPRPTPEPFDGAMKRLLAQAGESPADPDAIKAGILRLAEEEDG